MASSELQAVLAGAAEEATALGHGYLGPEHLLIAASRRVSPARADVLARHGLTPALLRAEVHAVLGLPAQTPDPAAVRPETTTRARRALDRAAERAGASAAAAVTADDLLAELLAEDVAPRAVIGAVLQRRAIDLSAIRRELFGPPELPDAS